MLYSALICRPAKNSHRKGFTLIETLIVATIFSFIALAIATSFMSGMKLWSRAKEGGFSKQNIVFAVERISQELRQAVNMPSIGFEGLTDEFFFPSVVNDSVVKVTYKFDQAEKMLKRKEISLKGVLSADTEEKSSGDGLKNFLSAETISLKYFCFDLKLGSYAWKETCEKDKEVFIAVKIDGQSEKNAFSKTVFMPAL